MNPYIDVNLRGNASKLSVQPIYQYDHGRKLRLRGLDLSKTIMVQYAYPGMAECQSVSGKTDGEEYVVLIPDAMLMFDRDITAFIYIEEESSGETAYEIHIPLIARPRPSELYTPEQIDNYGAAMLELTDAIEQVESIKSDVDDITNRATEAVETAEAWANATATATMLDSGSDPTIAVNTDENGNRVISFGIPAGKTGATGKDGGIGPAGQDGKDGISPTLSFEQIEGGHRVVLTDINGEQSFNVVNGQDGKDGADGNVADKVAWENIIGVPETFTPTSHTHTAKEIGAAEAEHSHTASDVGARSVDWVPSIADIEGLQESISSSGKVKTVNNKEADENGNINISASDVGAHINTWVPAISEIEGLQEAIDNAGKLKTVNNTAPDENGNIEITAAGIGALTVNDEIDAKRINGMTFDQLKQAIMAEAVYQ